MKLVRKIVAEFRKLEQELLQQDGSQWPEGRRQWTKKVLTTLCKLGRCLGYTAWATGDPKEWLYDVSWYNCDTCGRPLPNDWGNLIASLEATGDGSSGNGI